MWYISVIYPTPLVESSGNRRVEDGCAVYLFEALILLPGRVRVCNDGFEHADEVLEGLAVLGGFGEEVSNTVRGSVGTVH